MSGSADPPASGVARRVVDWLSITNFSDGTEFQRCQTVNLAYIVCGGFVFKTVFPYSGLDKLLIDGVVSWEIVVVSPAQCFSVWFM
jgi:hypothetical protein